MATPIFGNLVAGALWPSDVKDMVEEAILGVPALADSLAANRMISEQTWLALYTTKPMVSAKRAKVLVHRALSDTQLEHVADCESRSSLLERIMTQTPLSLANQRRIASGKGLSQTTAEILRCATWADPECAAAACKKAGGLVLLRWLSRSDAASCPRDEAEELLRSWREANSDLTGAVRGLLEELMERRGDLIGAAISVGQAFYNLVGAAAASRHLEVGDQIRILELVESFMSRAPVDKWSSEIAMSSSILGGLIKNPRVGGEVYARAVRLVTDFPKSDQVMPIASRAIAERSKTTFANDFVPCAYEEYDRPGKLLEFVVDQPYYSTMVPTVLALAHNRHLGEDDAAAVAGILPGFVNLHQISDEEYRSAQDALFAAWPALSVLRRDRPISGWTPKRRGTFTPYDAKPTWFEGDLTGEPRLTYSRLRTTVFEQPERYPLSLELLSNLNQVQHVAGVVAYMVQRIGMQPGVWRAVFTLAPDLAESDLDSLIDAATALNF